MNLSFAIYLLMASNIFSAEPFLENTEYQDANFGLNSSLGRIGDYGYPDNPQLDRAKGYLLKGKVKNAVSNYGNFITWDYHPAGLWNNFAYLPHVGFVAGLPGHTYSSKWTSVSYKSWIQASLQVGTESIEVWESSDAYNAWMDGVEISDATGEFEGNYTGIVYNTIDDRGDIATERSDVEDFIVNGDAQWVIDHVEEKIVLYLNNVSLDPNYVSSNIGLAYPWGIRPALKERTNDFDKYDYGEDLEEWTEDDNYVYYGATFAESWFTRDNGAKLTDWQASTQSRFTSHDLDVSAGSLFCLLYTSDAADE